MDGKRSEVELNGNDKSEREERGGQGKMRVEGKR